VPDPSLLTSPRRFLAGSSHRDHRLVTAPESPSNGRRLG
jgi:hypothetical protein